MSDEMQAHNMSDQDLIFSALIELGNRIEKCGASVELTHAVSLCSDLRQAIGNKFNPPNQHARARVLSEIPRHCFNVFPGK